MNQKALKTLEYHKIINMLLQHASSPMGQELCRQLTPSDDLNVVRGMQRQGHPALSEAPGHRQLSEPVRASVHCLSSGEYRPGKILRTS